MNAMHDEFYTLEKRIRSAFPKISEKEREARLAPPEGHLRMVLDTDTYNEVDDQFALAYAVRSPERLDVEAVYAAPFHNERSSSPKDGMEKSYQEILRLLGAMNVNPDGLVFKGSDRYLESVGRPVESAAAIDLVKKANQPGKGLLYVVAIGAITDVASAILLDPGIIDKIVVVWLGGQPLWWNDAREFNLAQDILAARVIFDSGVPLVLIPCLGVASHLLTTVPELETWLGGKNAICDSLVGLFKAYSADHFGWAKEIWDISTIGYMINPGWVFSDLVPSPILTADCRWETGRGRHMIRCAKYLSRNEIFRDMFRKLAK